MSFGFDLSKVDASGNDGGPIPAGRYTARIERVEQKVAKSNPNNKYLNIMYKICDMENRNGAVFFDVVNVINDNEKASEIGLKRLKSMFLAVGFNEEDASSPKRGKDDLIGKKLVCVLGIEKNAEYGDKNRVLQVLKGDFSDNLEAKESEKNAPSWL